MTLSLMDHHEYGDAKLACLATVPAIEIPGSFMMDYKNRGMVLPTSLNCFKRWLNLPSRILALAIFQLVLHNDSLDLARQFVFGEFSLRCFVVFVFTST